MPSRIFTPKEWQRSVSEDLRNEITTKMFNAIKSDPIFSNASTIDRLLELVPHITAMEIDAFEVANTRSEYYHLVAEIIFKMQNHLNESRRAREAADTDSLHEGVGHIQIVPNEEDDVPTIYDNHTEVKRLLEIISSQFGRANGDC